MGDICGRAQGLTSTSKPPHDLDILGCSPVQKCCWPCCSQRGSAGSKHPIALTLLRYALIWGFLGSFPMPPFLLVLLPPFMNRSLLGLNLWFAVRLRTPDVMVKPFCQTLAERFCLTDPEGKYLAVCSTRHENGARNHSFGLIRVSDSERLLTPLFLPSIMQSSRSAHVALNSRQHLCTQASGRRHASSKQIL